MMIKLDEQSVPHSRRVEVLVVDNEPVIVKRLATLLSGLGYTVTACTESENALEIIERKDFSLIITDFKMRKVDGIRILQEARLKDKGIKVIIMTGFGNGEPLSGVIRQERAELIHKPFKMEELRNAIASILPEFRKQLLTFTSGRDGCRSIRKF